MRRLLGTSFLLISTACFAADITPPVDMGGTPPMYGEPARLWWTRLGWTYVRWTRVWWAGVSWTRVWWARVWCA
jgi:hypothetical protein